jgi:adenylate cyclase
MTVAIPIGRISAFVRWVARTPWPVFMLGMLQADIIGALIVLGFLRFGLPPEDRIQLQDLPAFNLAVFLSYLFISFTALAWLTLRMLMPVIRWQRHDTLLGDEDPGVTELARVRALKMPFYRSVISVVNWCLGSIVFIVASWPVASHSAPVVAVATAHGATATAIIGYLQSERVLRPVASKFEILTAPAEKLNTPILLLAIFALVIGLAGTVLVAMSIADPLRQLRWALGEVQRGNYNAHMQIYDASELGLLQAGFNDMVRDLAERQRLRDLFGRYVGEDVARRALERGTELGGQERDVAVLFVDLVGSTQLASTRPASEVVSLLNEFFRVIVDAVNRHGGFVNKFQGDAALAIFGAPIEHPDASGAALAASRELHDELIEVLGQTDFGIGVSAGRAIAGHIGAQARFEYTVIGDPVNEAARLTELAKLEGGHVLASAIAVSGALDAEALCWDVGEIVELRGRTAPTQLARPVNLAAPDQVPTELQRES